MSRLSPTRTAVPVKMLLIGESGTGKTGAIGALAKDYRIILMDFDGGFDDSWIANKLRRTPELLANFYYHTYADKLKLLNSELVPDGMPTAWRDAMKDLTKWKYPDEDLGSSDTWDTDTVLVIDSFSFMGKAAFRYVDTMNQFKDGRQTFFEAQKLLESVLQLLCSPAMRCHVILTAHITLIDLENGLSKQYPATIGKAFSPTVPKYFNTMLEAQSKIEAGTAKRIIRTVPSSLIDTKHPVVEGLPAELPLDTGLATFFKANLTGEKPALKATELVNA